MTRKDVLGFLEMLLYDVETTIPEALIDDTWGNKAQALKIAIEVIDGLHDIDIESVQEEWSD